MTTDAKNTASDLRLQLNNADTAIAGIQAQINAIEQEMHTHEQAVTTLNQSAHARQLAMGDLQIAINVSKRDLQRLQTTSVVTAGTASEQRTRDSIASEQSHQAQLADQMQAAIVEDEDKRSSDQDKETEHDAAHTALDAQLVELQEHEQTLKQQREGIFEQLGQATYAEGTALLAELTASIGRGEAHMAQAQEALHLSRLALKTDLSPWYSLQQQAIREFQLNEKPPDSTSRVLTALVGYLEALEQDGVSLPAMIDGRFLVNELALDGATLQALLKRDREPIDRANDFRHRRSQLGELLRKHNSSR